MFSDLYQMVVCVAFSQQQAGVLYTCGRTIKKTNINYNDIHSSTLFDLSAPDDEETQWVCVDQLTLPLYQWFNHRLHNRVR